MVLKSRTKQQDLQISLQLTTIGHARLETASYVNGVYLAVHAADLCISYITQASAKRAGSSSFSGVLL